jgi:glycosyltransferase involved in cell wall biosynthesis
MKYYRIGFKTSFLMIILFFQTIFCSLQKKIVALMPVRNEARTIEQILRAVACYSDSIIILDDASNDTTLEILHNLASELTIEKIIEKKKWIRDEKADRQALLDAGRAAGGTHFIVLDADQMFSAHCLHNNWLRNKILQLLPGEVLRAPVINLWGSVQRYRDDTYCNPFQKHWIQPIAVCDDQVSNYRNDKEIFGESGSIHVWKFPLSLKNLRYQDVLDVNYGVLHFKSINLEDVFFKCIWYMFLEFVYLNKKNHNNAASLLDNAKKINNYYFGCYDGGEVAHDPQKAECSDVKESWYAYPFFVIDDFMKQDISRKTDIEKWINEYGVIYFAYLNIWDKPYFKKFIKDIGRHSALEDIAILREKHRLTLQSTNTKKKRKTYRRLRKK